MCLKWLLKCCCRERDELFLVHVPADQTSIVARAAKTTGVSARTEHETRRTNSTRRGDRADLSRGASRRKSQRRTDGRPARSRGAETETVPVRTTSTRRRGYGDREDREDRDAVRRARSRRERKERGEGRGSNRGSGSSEETLGSAARVRTEKVEVPSDVPELKVVDATPHPTPPDEPAQHEYGGYTHLDVADQHRSPPTPDSQPESHQQLTSDGGSLHGSQHSSQRPALGSARNSYSYVRPVPGVGAVPQSYIRPPPGPILPPKSPDFSTPYNRDPRTPAQTPTPSRTPPHQDGDVYNEHYAGQNEGDNVAEHNRSAMESPSLLALPQPLTAPSTPTKVHDTPSTPRNHHEAPGTPGSEPYETPRGTATRRRQRAYVESVPQSTDSALVAARGGTRGRRGAPQPVYTGEQGYDGQQPLRSPGEYSSRADSPQDQMEIYDPNSSAVHIAKSTPRTSDQYINGSGSESDNRPSDQPFSVDNIAELGRRAVERARREKARREAAAREQQKRNGSEESIPITINITTQEVPQGRSRRSSSRRSQTTTVTMGGAPRNRSRGSSNDGSIVPHAPGAPRIRHALPVPQFAYDETLPLPRTHAELSAALNSHLTEKNLHGLVSPEHTDAIARHAEASADAICADLGISPWATPDLTTVGLYDIVVFCDDSGSMLGESRFTNLRRLVARISQLAQLYRPASGGGISLRFVNYKHDAAFNRLSPAAADAALNQVHPRGSTRLGTALLQKVVRPFVIDPARAGTLERPVLCVVVTDGCPSKEEPETLKWTVLAAKEELRRSGVYGENAVVFLVSRVGSDPEAREYLQTLGNDEDLTGLVWCAEDDVGEVVRVREGESEMTASGKLLTWLTQLLANAVKA